MTHELNILHHRDRCRFLQSKGLFVNAGLKPGEEATGEGNYWCAKTQTVMGPDRQLCDPEYCLDPSRTCHEVLA